MTLFSHKSHGPEFGRPKTFTKRCEIAETQGLYLIGIARDVELRITRYGLPKTTKVINSFKKECSTAFEARKKEVSILKKFSHLKISEIQMRELHSISGFTECFSVSALEQLKHSLKY